MACHSRGLPIMAHRRGKSGSSDRFYFLELQNDGVFLLGRKSMINTGSVLKSRDITLPTKVCIVKAMVFPIVMYRCESWTIKKTEREELMLSNCGVGEDS